MSDRSDHPTAGKKRKHKSPAVAHVAPPVLSDHSRGDDDGPICSDEEKEAKRSAFTTPRSVRGTDPDDYDRVMGVSSVGPKKRLGLVRKMQLTLMTTRKELLTTKVTQMKPEKELPPTQQYQPHAPQAWRMILVLAETRGDTGGLLSLIKAREVGLVKHLGFMS